MLAVPRGNRELFTKAGEGDWSSRFMVRGRCLWKLKEIVIFALSPRGDGPNNPENNSLVIHSLITVRSHRNERVSGASFYPSAGDRSRQRVHSLAAWAGSMCLNVSIPEGRNESSQRSVGSVSLPRSAGSVRSPRGDSRPQIILHKSQRTKIASKHFGGGRS
jgi:hypothetical protein